jgi:DNA-nicking Smr family endonuclease
MNDENIQESGEIEFSNEIDLHHFSPKDTRFLIEHIIGEACAHGIKEVKIIHGKGRSAKKREIYELLNTDPRVISWRDDGYNWGATIVTLVSPEK